MRELTKEIEYKIEEKARNLLVGFDEETILKYILFMKQAYKDNLLEVE